MMSFHEIDLDFESHVFGKVKAEVEAVHNANLGVRLACSRWTARALGAGHSSRCP